MTPWEIKAREFSNCNCAYGCPCQFNALPTYGNCEAVAGMEIDKGHYGDVCLDGLRFAAIFYWPGPIHEGKGKCQPIVDVRADAKQREALLKIVSGEDTDPLATVFAVFASTMETTYPPLFEKIDFTIDIEARTGKLFVKDAIDCSGEPIRDPTTGDALRARIELPDGFEFTVAEMGSASSVTQGEIKLNLKDSYGQFSHLHLNNHGVVR